MGRLAGYVEGGALATGTLRQGLLGSQAGDFRVVIRLAQVGKHQHLGRAVEVLREKSLPSPGLRGGRGGPSPAVLRATDMARP